MCGIAGIVGAAANQHIGRLPQMLAALTHRGPDGEGRFAGDGCLLGHRRLSIVDLEGGGQPMSNPQSGVTITFNGEIYGFSDLRNKFSRYAYRTQSDTEVILAMYDELGPSFVRHLPGMFALAIWDPNSQSLFCARDRFGEKPFYFAVRDDGLLVFASEIKGLSASRLVELNISYDAIEHYVRRLYIHPHETVFNGVRVLPPGHSLSFSRGRATVEQYWSAPGVRAAVSSNEAAEEMRFLLKRAVARQLVANVPVGAFLSGGLDSSTIVACAADVTRQIQTFTVDIGCGASEVPFAHDVAQRHSTKHADLRCDDYDIADEIVRMSRIFDEPFGDSSAIPTFLIAREARKVVKVVLTGDGGDEFTGGYGWYRPLAWLVEAKSMRSCERALTRLALGMRSRLGILRSPAEKDRADGVAMAMRYQSISAAHEAQLQFASGVDLELIGLRPASQRPPWNGLAVDPRDELDSAFRADALDYMPGDILVKIDRASMANGLELRAPFLDIDFAEFMLSLPSALKVTPFADKILLREAFSSLWPESVINRSKQGFGAPVEEWLKHPRVRELEHAVLRVRSAALYDFLDFDGAQILLDRASAHLHWALLALGAWAEETTKVRRQLRRGCNSVS